MSLEKTLCRLIRASALAAASILVAAPALAQSIVSTGQSFVKVSLLPGRAEPDGTRMAGLVVDLKPGWKTYWRSPGEAGLPPSFDWSHSRNLASAELHWPRPQFFDSFGVRTLGYSGRVVFPVRLVPKDPSRPMAVHLDLALGVCHDLCVLEKTKVDATIRADSPETGAALVAVAESKVPRPASALGLTEAQCRISGAGKTRDFEATLDFDHQVKDPRVVLEGPDLAWFKNVQTTPGPDGRLHVDAELNLLDAKAWVGRSDIRMTVLAENFAADVKGCAAPQG